MAILSITWLIRHHFTLVEFVRYRSYLFPRIGVNVSKDNARTAIKNVPTTLILLDFFRLTSLGMDKEGECLMVTTEVQGPSS